jgi:hypothetical protein
MQHSRGFFVYAPSSPACIHSANPQLDLRFFSGKAFILTSILIILKRWVHIEKNTSTAFMDWNDLFPVYFNAIDYGTAPIGEMADRLGRNRNDASSSHVAK